MRITTLEDLKTFYPGIHRVLISRQLSMRGKINSLVSMGYGGFSLYETAMYSSFRYQVNESCYISIMSC